MISQLNFFGKEEPRERTKKRVVTTLKQAKAWLWSRLRAGEMVNCPCCGRTCKIYERKLNSNMARFLIDLVYKWRLEGKKPIHKDRLVWKGYDYSCAAWWGLVETFESETREKRMSGFYVPTEKGIAFAAGRITVPRTVTHFNREILSYSDERIDIRAALGSKFNYQELMNAYGES